MLLRVLTLALVLGAAAPAAAQEDPLLSGYGGPGAGDQAILGETFLPAASPNGSLRATSGRGTAAPATGATATGTSGAGTTAPPTGTPGLPSTADAGPRPAGGAEGAGRTPGAGGSPAAGGAPRGGSPSTSPAPTAPAVVATDGSAGAPVGRHEVVIALLVLGAIGAIALATSRLARTPLRA